MPSVTITMTAEKAADVASALRGLWPIPQIPDPEWVDPEDGSAAPLMDEFTDIQWAKKKLIGFLVQSKYRWQKKQETLTSTVVEDPDLAT